MALLRAALRAIRCLWVATAGLAAAQNVTTLYDISPLHAAYVSPPTDNVLGWNEQQGVGLWAGTGGVNTFREQACLLLEDGRLMCWAQLGASDQTYFLNLDRFPTLRGARMVSMQNTLGDIIITLSTGDVLFVHDHDFSWPPRSTASTYTNYGLLPGPWLDFRMMPKGRTGCGIRGDGELECMWLAPTKATPYVQNNTASTFLSNLTAAKSVTALCGGSCSSASGPFKPGSLQVWGHASGDFDPCGGGDGPGITWFSACAIRLNDSSPWCAGHDPGPLPGRNDSFLPSMKPALISYNTMNVSMWGQEQGTLPRVQKLFTISQATGWGGNRYSVVAIPESPTAPVYEEDFDPITEALVAQSYAHYGTTGSTWNPPVRGADTVYPVYISQNLRCDGWGGSSLQLSRDGRIRIVSWTQGGGGARFGGLFRDDDNGGSSSYAPSGSPWKWFSFISGPYLSVTAADNGACALRSDLSPECWYIANSQSVQDLGPLLPQGPIQPNWLFTFRGSAEMVCAELPYVDNIIGTTNLVVYAIRCFGTSYTSLWSEMPSALGLLPWRSKPITNFAASRDTFVATTAGNPTLAWGSCSTTIVCSTMSQYSVVLSNIAVGAGGWLCGLTNNTGLFECYGGNIPGTSANRSVLTTPSSYPAALVAGDDFLCSILLSDSSLYCFGSNNTMWKFAASALLSSRTEAAIITNSSTHIALAGPFVNITAGTAYVCMLTQDRMPVCVGVNAYGQLNATAVPMRNIYAGHQHACGIVATNLSAVCWGRESPYGSVNGTYSPGIVNQTWSWLGPGVSSTCGLTTDGYLKCWGYLSRFYGKVQSPYLRQQMLADTSKNSLSVGLSDGDDGACLASESITSCATLVGAVSAIQASVTRRAVVKRIVLYGSTSVVAPVTVAGLGAGLLITGSTKASNSRSRLLVQPAIARNSSSASFDFRGDGIVLANLDIVVQVPSPSSTMNCSDGFRIAGAFNYMVNVSITGFNCNNSIISVTSSSTTGWTRGSVFTSVNYDTMLLDNVVIANCSAPAYIRAWSFPQLRLNNVIASHTGGTPAGFLTAAEMQKIIITGSNISNFITAALPYPTASTPASSPPLCGAAVSARDVPWVTITTSSFINITSTGSGGALLCALGSFALPAVSISNVTGVDISGAGAGGAILVRTGPSMNVVVRDCSLSNVRSIGSGGALFVYGASTAGLFNLNLASTKANGDGGAVTVLATAAATMYGLTVSNSSSVRGRGGAVFVANVMDTSIASTTIVDSTAAASAGAIAVICGESASATGGLYPTCNARLQLVQISRAVSTSGSGGGIYIASVNPRTVVPATLDWTITSCTALQASGGGLLYDAGAIAGSKLQLQMTNSSFIGNIASNGGGVHVSVGSVSYLQVTATDCTFTDNAASNVGGGLRAVLSVVLLTRSTFTRNTAYKMGGGAATSGSQLSIDASRFEGNVATAWSGGALAVQSCILSGLQSIWFPSSTSSSGSAGIGSVFVNNTAASYGGAIYTQFCDVTLPYVVLTSNLAGDSGGGLAVDAPAAGSSVIVGPLVAVGNTANSGSAGGGAVFVRNAATTISLCPWVSSAPIQAQTCDGAVHAAWLQRAFASTNASATTVAGQWLPAALAQWTNNTAEANIIRTPVNVTSNITLYTVNCTGLNATVRAGNGCGNVTSGLVRVNATVVNVTIIVTNVTTPLDSSNFTADPRFGLHDAAASCVFANNAASNGYGGDVYLERSPIDSAKLAASDGRSIGVGGYAALGGGSAALFGVSAVSLAGWRWNASTAGAPTANAATASASTARGGGVYLHRPRSLSLSSCAFQACTAHEGGAIFLRRHPAANDAPTISLLTANLSDTMSLANISYVNNTAILGGGNWYTDLGPAIQPSCIGCSGADSGRGLQYGNDESSGPRAATIALSPYRQNYTHNGTIIDAVIVVSSRSVAQPLVTLWTTDLLGSRVASDNGTACTVTIDGTTAGLNYANTYSAVNGAIKIYPFVWAVGPDTVPYHTHSRWYAAPSTDLHPACLISIIVICCSILIHGAVPVGRDSRCCFWSFRRLLHDGQAILLPLGRRRRGRRG